MGPPSVDAGPLLPGVPTFLGECRFQDCVHVNEPACAVRAATTAGVIDAGRYDSYRRMREELIESERIY